MRRRFPKKILILLLVVALTLLCIYTPLLSKIGNGVGVVFSPVQNGITKCINGVKGYFDYLGRLGDADKENQQLIKEIDKLMSQKSDYDSLKRENERLNDLLEFKNNYPEKNTVAAEVISKNGGNWFQVFTINKGKKDGIAVNDTVLNSKGLIGRVSECGTNYSKIITVIDASHSVSGVIGRTGDFVQLDGDI